MDKITVALWSTNLGHELRDLDDWLGRVDAKLALAAEEGAEILLAPEYWCEQWLSFRPDGLETEQEIGWMADLAPRALEGLKRQVAARGVALLAGTMPWSIGGGGHANRAHFLTPEGDVLVQDKLFLTPSEKAPAPWALTPGHEIAMLDWRGIRVAVVICLDIEVPAFSVLMARHRPDIVLVPSMTAYHSGYNRVYGCAKARAVELMTAVAVSGCVGATPRTTYNDTNVSGAALYLPCEREFGMTGILADHPPVAIHHEDGPWVIARDLPLAELRVMRDEGAEVWPGPVSAQGIRVRVGPAVEPETPDEAETVEVESVDLGARRFG